MEIWEEYVMGDSLDPEECYSILDAISSSSSLSQFGTCIDHLLTLWETLPNEAIKGKILEKIIDIDRSQSAPLKACLMSWINAQYSPDENETQIRQLSGIETEKQIPFSLRRYALLKHLKPGHCLLHKGSKGRCLILSTSWIRQEVEVEFEISHLSEYLTFSTLFSLFDILPPEHFLAKRLSDPDALEKMGMENPTVRIFFLLQDMGPQTAQQNPSLVCDHIIPTDKWDAWWKQARKACRQSPSIIMPHKPSLPLLIPSDSSTPSFSLPVDFAEQELERKIALLKGAIKHHALQPLEQDLIQTIVSGIEEAINDHDVPAEQKLLMAMLLDTLVDQPHYGNEIIKQLGNSHHIIQSLPHSLRKKAIHRLIQLKREDVTPLLWHLLRDSSSAIRESLFHSLSTQGKQPLLDQLIDDHTEGKEHNVSFILWYILWKRKKNSLYGDAVLLFRLAKALITQVYHLPSNDPLRKEVKNLFLEKKLLFCRNLFAHLKKEELDEILLLLEKSHLFSSHNISNFFSLARVACPEGVWKETSKPEERRQWSTEKSYEELIQKIEHLSTVEMVANAREIEAARALGDLKENAEFKSAIEKKSRIQNDIKRLSEQFKNTHILKKEHVSTDYVGPGAILHCEKEGDSFSFTILGPLDAQPDQNIFSSESRVGRQVEGARVGDTIEIAGHLYTLKRISNYFDEIRKTP
ncbi:MAG: GreA/GreB family elongation factor [Chlamydiota bacterium]|nr:GreA/GreB family elongation factor [Chlamydiota bacterium]